MSKRLNNKVALVTGGGSGIGEAICRRFAAEGAGVAVMDLNEEQGNRVAEAIREEGGNALFVQTNVTDAASVQQAIATAVEALGRPDILVNNAGIAHIGNVEEVEEADLDRLYNVNIKGVYFCAKAVIPHLREQGGGIILNMASVAATAGIPDRFAYSMTKGAVAEMTRSLAVDYLADNIRCNSISPARVHTPFVDNYLKNTYPGREEEMYEQLAATQPIGRMGRPDEIAGLAAYLCSDEAAFITGADYLIDGGFCNLKP